MRVIDLKSREKEQILNSNEIYFIRGYFIDKTIDIENKLIYIIAQYCAEDTQVYHMLGYTLMKKELPFSVLVYCFNNANILKDVANKSISKKEINIFKESLSKIIEIRNKLAHWNYTNSENEMFNSDSQFKLTRELKEEWYNSYELVEDYIYKINTSFLEWDNHFVMFDNWSNAKTKKGHKTRVKEIQNLIKKAIPKKYDLLFKEFNFLKK